MKMKASKHGLGVKYQQAHIKMAWARGDGGGVTAKRGGAWRGGKRGGSCIARQAKNNNRRRQ
jgi:hypothetical protein